MVGGLPVVAGLTLWGSCVQVACVSEEGSRINQADIARALGISQSTVSIALKGDPRVAKKTRDLIHGKAKELGYAPDPNLLALSQYRSSSKSTKIVAGLAWVTNHGERDGWSSSRMCLAYREAVEARARKLGYQLYDFWLREPEVSLDRLRQILQSRGIRGLVFAPQERFDTRVAFDFRGFAAVALGYTLSSPALHVVSNHQHSTVRLAYGRLKALGYERIGLILNSFVDARVAGAFSGGFFSMNPNCDSNDFVPPFLFEDFDLEAFWRWREQWRPDAVLASGQPFGLVRASMAERGLRFGEDLGLAELNLMTTDGSMAGVNQRPDLVGTAAANMVDAQLSHFEYGVPENPMRILVEGEWVDGATAPSRS